MDEDLDSNNNSSNELRIYINNSKGYSKLDLK